MSEIFLQFLNYSKISECQKPKISDHAQKCTAFLTHDQEPPDYAPSSNIPPVYD